MQSTLTQFNVSAGKCNPHLLKSTPTSSIQQHYMIIYKCLYDYCFFCFFEAFLVFAFCCYRRLCLRCIRQSCCQSLCTKCCGEAISASIHYQPSTFEDMAPQIARPMAAAKPKKVQDVEVASSGGDLVFEDDFWECLGESILGLTSLT